MKTAFKRAAAWILTALMIFNCVPVSAQDTSTDYSGDQISLADYVTTAEDITITFVINNSNYTCDPGSGNTHITATTPIEGGELTYTLWSGQTRYKVTGTGTVCSYTIPSGTSLSANGYSFPAIAVENIGNTNTYTYSSRQTWITSEGMVCNTDTAFAEDTTLYLQLYENGAEDVYSVDFVCGEDNHSIKSTGSFRLGQSLSQAHIDAATEAANSFESQFCTYGPASGQSLQKWQLKVTATGEMVDLYAGMPITEAYVNSEYGTLIKAYAVWETTSVPVSATFQHVVTAEDGTQTTTVIETRELTSGSALGELPDMSAYATEEESFLGWQYTDADGNLQYATAETIITADTVYTAVFGEAEYVSLIFHDIQPDGKEGSISIDLSVPMDRTIADSLLENDAALADGKMISECIWYTLDESGAKTRADFTVNPTGEMHLYTYTYQIILTLNPNTAAEAAVYDSRSLVESETAEDGTITLTITLREGETLTAADFVTEDGVDLTLYTWTDADGNTVDLLTLINSGVTGNITVTSDGTLALTSLTEHEEGHSVNFYVFVDNERKLVSSRTIIDYYNSSRHYISAATLESAYGAYGFSAGSLAAGNYRFAHTDIGGATIWPSAAEAYDGSIFIPSVIHDGPVDIYYVPAGNVTAAVAYSERIATNTFYSVTVTDPLERVYTDKTLPDVTYTFTGGTATVTVDTPDGVTWVCVGADGSTTIAGVTSNGKTTFTISGISQPYTLMPSIPSGSAALKYDVNPPGTPVDEYSTPNVEGALEYSVVVDSTTPHTLLEPSITSYFYTSGKYLGEATFLGWAVNGDTANLLQAGAALDLTAYDGQYVTLIAQWDTDLGAAVNSSMVNFFVSLDALSEGTTTWTGDTSGDAFTASVYTTDCGVTGSQVITDGLYEETITTTGGGKQYVVLGSTSGANLEANHNTVTSGLTAGYTVDDVTFTASFPSDETVLRNVRAMVKNGTEITINGVTIAEKDLTTANFTIKWYIFKVASDDGWHIDGILVAKTAELLVSKTFAGDDDSIAAVKTDYSIGVSGGSVNTGETLTTSNADSVSGNTYTWTVPVDQYYDYTVTENNYLYDENLTTSTAQYRVLNSVNGQNVSWTDYSGGITVTGQGHNEQDDDRLTVEFLNTYTAAGTVVLQKIDAATGNLMPNVSFEISQTMYDQGGGNYSADPNDADGGTATTTITTNSAGQAYLWIGGGTYTLTEAVPTGYDDPGAITAVLEGDADNQYKVIRISSLTASNDEKDFTATGGADGLTMIVKNYSRTIDVTVNKVWTDGENKPVTIQLYRNGVALGSDYTVTLDGSASTGWSSTFTGLPLYVDGGLAQYSIREEAIGDFKYSDEYAGGYRYYDVNYTAAQYLDESGAVTSDMSAVKTIALSVSNTRSTGSLAISKVDENGTGLGGAVFYLYEAPELNKETSVPSISGNQTDGYTLDATLVRSSTSSATGAVSFANLDAGRYYLIEHKAPTGYTGSGDVYALQFDGDSATLTLWTGDAWVSSPLSIANTSIKGEKTVTKVWDDNGDAFGLRPDSVTLILTGTAGGSVVHTQQAELSGEDGDVDLNSDGTTTASSAWQHTFTNVPLYSSGAEIVYTVSENAVTNYTAEYDQDTLTVTNTLGVTDVTITKQVTGNFADPSASFPFTALVTSGGETVKLEAGAGYTVDSDGTIRFSLSHNGSVTIANVPLDATVTVSETNGQYTPTYQIGSSASAEGATAVLNVGSGQTTVAFLNTYNVSIDTGVDLDGMPYTMLLLGAAGLGLVWLLLARRRRNDD